MKAGVRHVPLAFLRPVYLGGLPHSSPRSDPRRVPYLCEPDCLLPVALRGRCLHGHNCFPCGSYFVDLYYTVSVWLWREALRLICSLDALLTTQILGTDALSASVLQLFWFGASAPHAVVASVSASLRQRYYNNAFPTNDHMGVSLMVVRLPGF